MSIFDSLFKSAAPSPAPAPAPAQQQQQLQGNQPVPPPANPPMQNNPAMPTQQSQLNGAGQEQNPLDAFKDIFTPAPPATNPDGTPIAAAPTQAVTFDQAQVAQRLQGMDFMRFAQQADLQAVAQGGEGAVAALGNVINSVMRQSMLMQTGFAAQSANTAAQFAQQQATAGLPEMVRGQLTQSEMAGNAAINHPALAPMVQALRQQFQTQYPKASPAELANHLNNYMQAVSGVFAPKPDPAAAQQNIQQQTQDWNNWFKQ